MGFRVAEADKLLAAGDKITVSADTVLKAIWGYDVSYDGGAATVVEEGTTVTVAGSLRTQARSISSAGRSGRRFIRQAIP